MFGQISARVKELKTVGHDKFKKVSDELRISVDQALHKNEVRSRALSRGIRYTEEGYRDCDPVQRKKSIRQSAGRFSQINDIKEELGRTLNKYPWFEQSQAT